MHGQQSRRFARSGYIVATDRNLNTANTYKTLDFIGFYRGLFGGQGRDRTGDTRIFSPLLYQLSYLATIVQGLNGRSAGIRTLDPVIKSHLLYQLSYAPIHRFV